MKVLTNVVNSPIFIEIQYYTLKKYLKNDFEFIVFNDAKEFSDFTNEGDITLKTQIKSKCKELNIKCININNDHHSLIQSGSVRHSHVLNEMQKFQLENPDHYLILDSDMFLIDYIDINKYSNFKAAIVLQQRLNNTINYIWPGLYYIDMTIKNNQHLLKWDVIPNTDTGGASKEWLTTQINKDEMIPNTTQLRHDKITNYNTKNIYFIKHLWSCSWDETELPEQLKSKEKLISFLKQDSRNTNNKFFCEIYDNCFLHYRGACNWRGEGLDFHSKLSHQLKDSLLN